MGIRPLRARRLLHRVPHSESQLGILDMTLAMGNDFEDAFPQALLDLVGSTSLRIWASVHDATPTNSDDNEVTVTNYARQQINGWT